VSRVLINYNVLKGTTFLVVRTYAAAPEEVDVCTRAARPSPYAVCCGCSGAVQIDAYEMRRDMVAETWHPECYAEYEEGGGDC